MVSAGTACVDSLATDGALDGLDGGGTLDAAAGLTPQAPPALEAVCTTAANAGSPCSAAGACCGVASGKEICSFGGAAQGTCELEPPLHEGNTWADLYADYFGGTGRAACAGNGSCHGSTGAAGYLMSGYLCPPDDPTPCYDSITSREMDLILPGMAFDQDGLYSILRKVDPKGTISGEMPAEPTEVYAFTQTDIARISAWVATLPSD